MLYLYEEKNPNLSDDYDAVSFRTEATLAKPVTSYLVDMDNPDRRRSSCRYLNRGW